MRTGVQASTTWPSAAPNGAAFLHVAHKKHPPLNIARLLLRLTGCGLEIYHGEPRVPNVEHLVA